ncbi:WG repeat-containing protein, partial [Campylobacter concisus]
MFWGFDGAWSFNKGFAKVKKDGKWGYINTKGEQIVECKFDGA